MLKKLVEMSHEWALPEDLTTLNIWKILLRNWLELDWLWLESNLTHTLLEIESNLTQNWLNLNSRSTRTRLKLDSTSTRTQLKLDSKSTQTWLKLDSKLTQTWLKFNSWGTTRNFADFYWIACKNSLGQMDIANLLWEWLSCIWLHYNCKMLITHKDLRLHSSNWDLSMRSKRLF